MAKKDQGRMTGSPVTYPIPSPAGGVRMETFLPWTLVNRGVKREGITPLRRRGLFAPRRRRSVGSARPPRISLL